jgi:hypothetical protein
MSTLCRTCREPIEQPPSGGLRLYCSAACRQAAYRRRKVGASPGAPRRQGAPLRPSKPARRRRAPAPAIDPDEARQQRELEKLYALAAELRAFQDTKKTPVTLTATGV